MKEKIIVLRILVIMLILSAISFWFTETRTFLYVMLNWNILLALTPLFIIKVMKRVSTGIMKLFFIAIWLFFLPNAFYMLTDLIHIQNIPFHITINPYNTIYNRDIVIWVELVTILMYSVIGFYLGLVATFEMHNTIGNTNKYRYLISISFLSGIAIYIGRFLRLNSWDMINPVLVTKSVLASFDLFSLLFIMLFTCIIFFSTNVYYSIQESVVSEVK